MGKCYLKFPKATEPTRIVYGHFINEENKVFQFSTSEMIHPDQFDTKSGSPILVKSTSRDYRRLEQIRTNLKKYDQFLTQLQKVGVAITHENLKREFKAHFKKKTSERKLNTSSVIDVYEIFVEVRSIDKNTKKPIAEGTMKRYRNFGNILRDYDASLTWRKVNSEFGDRFLEYLLTRLSNATAKRMMISLKAFLDWAFEEGYLQDKSYRSYPKGSVNKAERDKVVLSRQQLEAISNLELDGLMDLVRDQFLIGCNSGLRISDIKRINIAHLRSNGRLLVINHQKTQNVSKIPVTPQLRAILDKYNWQMPTVTDPTFNKYLKRICKLAGLDQLQTYMIDGVEYTDYLYNRVTSHCSKRTYVTYLASKGIPVSIISEITGTSIRTLEAEYIRVQEKDIEQVLSLLS